MQRIWILARSRFEASEALRRCFGLKALKCQSWIDFKYVVTAEMVLKADYNEKFILARGWEDNPDIKKIIAAVKEKNWEFLRVKDIFL